MAEAPLLAVRGLSKRFGGLLAVSDVDLDVAPGRITGLVGPNGAGKTTCFAMLAGFIRADAGRIVFDQADVTGWPPHATAARGMVRTFQVTQPFARLSVLQNVMVGAYLRHPARLDARAHAAGIGARLGLGPYLDRPADSLTVAMRKRLELARALATGPKLLLLDEVMAGLNPADVGASVELLKRVRDSGVSILAIEHVMAAVMALSDRIVVINSGKMIAEGTPSEIAHNPIVLEAYLGEDYVHVGS